MLSDRIYVHRSIFLLNHIKLQLIERTVFYVLIKILDIK